MEIGKQYKKDDTFKSKARLHQSTYRANVLGVDYEEFGNMLLTEDAKKGLNFYSDFNIFQAAHDRYGKKYSKQLYANLLRSEHIPLNLFIPLLHCCPEKTSKTPYIKLNINTNSSFRNQLTIR